MKSTCLALALLASLVPAQTPRSDPAAESRAESRAETRADSRPAASDPKAVAIFRKGAATQAMDGKPVVIQDFQADFEATLFEFDEKTKERRPHSAHLTEFWKRTSDPMARYRRHLIEPLDQKTTVHGYDGRIFWQQLGTAAADELRGRNARTDVQKIRDEINRTTEFLRLLVLSNLEDAGVTWTMTPTTKVRTNDAERDVVGIRRTKDGERPIELLFGTTDSRLYAFIRDGDDKHPKESILFAVHEPVGVAGGRLLVPQVIQYKENDALTVEARVAKPTDLKFNVNLEEKLFQIPR